MLYLIGLGLSDNDISLKGIEALKESEKIYAEFYTSPNVFDLEKLEARIGNDVVVLSREEVEQEGKVLKSALERKTAFLVSGDPLTATTHYEIYKEAEKEGIETEIIHSSSIFTAVAETGLSLYKFGRTTTLPKKEKEYLPESPYEVIEKNLENELHTLLLIDPGLGLNNVCELLKELEDKREEGIFSPERKIFVLEKVGTQESEISFLKFEEALHTESSKKPLAMVVPGEMDHKEKEFSSIFK